MILKIVGVVLFVLFFIVLFIIIGYKLAMMRWSVKELVKTSNENFKLAEQLTKVNNEQLSHITNINNTIIKNKEWYIVQLRTIATYIKDKYNDNIIYNQIGAILGSNLEETEFKQKKDINYNIDEILDKINMFGFDSLTIDEINFLKKYGEL